MSLLRHHTLSWCADLVLPLTSSFDSSSSITSSVIFFNFVFVARWLDKMLLLLLLENYYYCYYLFAWVANFANSKNFASFSSSYYSSSNSSKSTRKNPSLLIFSLPNDKLSSVWRFWMGYALLDTLCKLLVNIFWSSFFTRDCLFVKWVKNPILFKRLDETVSGGITAGGFSIFPVTSSGF